MHTKFMKQFSVLLLSLGAFAVGTNAVASDCNCEQVSWEKGVKVYRANPAHAVSLQALALHNDRIAASAKETARAQKRAAHQAAQNRLQTQTYDRAYQNGYEAGQKAANSARRRNRTRRNPYNYGRRYSTSFQNPRYARFRSNLSYARPAYIQAYRLRD